jgi:hypothetical protein
MGQCPAETPEEKMDDMLITLCVSLGGDEKQIAWHFEVPEGWGIVWKEHQLTLVTDGGHEFYPARGEDEMKAIQDYLALVAERE